MKNYNSDMDHEFVIPAYGTSPYLESCIQSILDQSIGTPRILVGTSTPSAFLDGVGANFGLKIRVNSHRENIAGDWNFVMEASKARFVTIAHQDDLYRRTYLEKMTQFADRYPDLVLAFSNYRECTDSGDRSTNINLRAKRILCARAFGTAEFIEERRLKERLLNLGNPICCPSVMINRQRAPDFEFSGALKTNLDWDAWLRLAAEPGLFVYARDPLVSKRVHPNSETSVTIANRTRQREDRHMFERFWPKPVAAAIAAVYAWGYRANNAA